MKLSSKAPQIFKAAIYIRVSTAKQAKEGTGLEEQLNKCLAMLTVKDWKLYKIYCNEKGISGTTVINERKDLQDLIDDGKQGLFQGVVFNSLDRLGRSTKIVLQAIDEFQEANLKFVSCKENIDTSTASGELMLTFFAGIAQYERRVIVERMAAGKEIQSLKYGDKGGQLPLGYMRGENNQVIINPIEAAIVRNIFIARNKGVSMNSIAKWLNDLGLKSRRDKKWYSATVSIILKNQDKYEGGIRGDNQNGVRWPKILYYSDDEIEEMREEREQILSNKNNIQTILQKQGEAKIIKEIPQNQKETEISKEEENENSSEEFGFGLFS